MKAGIYLGQKNIEIKNIDIPQVGDNDVLIKNIYSGICGTDVAVFMYGENTGHKITVGGEFGHETISKVVKLGKNVTDFSIGERVYPYPRFAKGDTRRAGTIGGFSEYILIPNVKRNHSLYSVDKNISDKLACLIEPFTVGCRAARRAVKSSTTNTTDSAIVFGCGTIGIATAVALKHFGVERVMVCDKSDFRLKLVSNLGFTVCNTSAENFNDNTHSYFGTAPSLSGSTANIDCWIDTAGAESIFDNFMKLGKIESRFVSVAVNKALRKLDLLHMTYSQKSIVGSGGYMPEDVLDVQKIMASKKWDLESIITHQFSIDELQLALNTASNVDSAGSVVIKF